MAGDWIKMQIDLADKPKVIALAGRLNLDVDSVVGKLHRLWGWADRQTTDGNAPGVTTAFIDSRMGVTGFADALQSIGWLEVSQEGIRLVRFEEHNGKTAKTRALTANRVAGHRASLEPECNDADVTLALAREEERESREEREKKVVIEVESKQTVASRAKARSAKTTVCDDEFLVGLQAKECYQGLNVRLLYGKMVVWCELKRKQPTRARLINWLNNEDQPMNGNGHATTQKRPSENRREAEERFNADDYRPASKPVIGAPRSGLREVH